MIAVPFSSPSLTKTDLDSIINTYRKGWITGGDLVFKFEKAFARYIGAPYCVAVSSCTSAMYLTLLSLSKRPRSIALPSLTFAATAEVCLHAGIDLNFTDIDPVTFLMRPTRKPSLPVHFAGLYCHQPQPILEDSAHRVAPASFTGTPTCFSFYATKNMTTGEGGMIATGDERQAVWLRKARLHGLSGDAWKRYQPGTSSHPYRVEFPGYKENMTDPQAALGLSQLRRLPRMNRTRKKLARRYRERLGGIDRDVDHLYVVLVNRQDKFIDYMRAHGVQCSVHFPPLHLQPAYKKYRVRLPVTEHVCRHIVSLPLYYGLTLTQVDAICRLVENWQQKNGKPELL